MKVYKDILDHLHIEHIFITGAKNCFCTLLEIEDTYWKVVIDTPFNDEEATLHVKYNGSYIDEKVLVFKDTVDMYKVEFINKTNEIIKIIFASIKQLIADEKSYNKRKEDRYEMGIKYSMLFNLKTVEQKVSTKGIELPCMVNDVSFNGMRVTTFERESLKKSEEISIVLRFSKPIECLEIKGYIQSIVVKTVKNSIKSSKDYHFALISVKFINTPLSYKQRLGSYLDSIVKE
jgi:hypothetical protein